MKLLKKVSSMPTGVKASFAFFFASVITSGISYIVTPIYTRILEKEVFGQVSVFLTWLEIFGILAMFCLSYGVFNNGMIDHPDKRDEYSFSMLMLSNVITLCFSGILLGLYPFIRTQLGMDLRHMLFSVEEDADNKDDDGKDGISTIIGEQHPVLNRLILLEHSHNTINGLRRLKT